MKNKRGLSGIVVVLILVLLALAVGGIIWAVISNFVGGGVGDIEFQQKCIGISVDARSVIPVEGGEDGEYNLRLYRRPGGGEIGGIRATFLNDTDSSPLLTFGNLEEGQTTTVTFDTGILDASEVHAYVFFIDEEGNERLCSDPVVTYEF